MAAVHKNKTKLDDFKLSDIMAFEALLVGTLALVASSSGIRRIDRDVTTMWFIGDLHGDDECAKAWLTATGAITFDESSKITWTGRPDEVIIFMGDYVDKGVRSRQSLELMRSLTDALPDHVVAVVGNHDLFALLDASLTPSRTRPMGTVVAEFSYAFAHPQSYLESGWSPKRADDEELLGALLSALEFVYAHHGEGRVALRSDAERPLKMNRFLDIFASGETAGVGVPPFGDDAELAKRTRERLATWEREWAAGFLESGLASWLQRRPIVAVVGDAIVAHAGLQMGLLDREVRALAAERGLSHLDALHAATNERFWAWCARNIANATVPFSVAADFDGLDLVSDAVQHRGYFKSHGGPGCDEVSEVLAFLNANANADANAKGGEDEKPKKAETRVLHRIVVGHTPEDDVQILCDGALVAADSALSRPFRANGNYYCAVGEALSRRIVLSPELTSQCVSVLSDGPCEGSIARLSRKSARDEWPVRAEAITFADLQHEAATAARSSSSSAAEEAKAEPLAASEAAEEEKEACRAPRSLFARAALWVRAALRL